MHCWDLLIRELTLLISASGMDSIIMSSCLRLYEETCFHYLIQEQVQNSRNMGSEVAEADVDTLPSSLHLPSRPHYHFFTSYSFYLIFQFSAPQERLL